MKEKITFEEFLKSGLKIGTVLSAERIEGSSKLLRLQVDLGDEKRQIVAGIGKFISPEELTGKQVPIATGVAPAVIMGVESNGVLVAVSHEGVVLLQPQKQVPNGADVL